MDLMDDQCLRSLQFRKASVRELCNLLQPDLQPQTVATKVTRALNSDATGSFQAATADILNISQFAMHNSIRQVTDALYKRGSDYIFFLMSREKQFERQTGFVLIAGFHRVLGAIDCTHVALRAPQNSPEMFRNCKGFNPIKVQLMCDHHCKIMAVDVVEKYFRDFDARYPGSSHDAPSAIRCIIEQSIGIRKQRFRCLDRSGGVLQYSPKRVSLFVVLCRMLHNLPIMRVQPVEDEPAVPPEEEDQEEEVQEQVTQEKEEEAPKEDHDAGHRPRHPNPAREASHCCSFPMSSCPLHPSFLHLHGQPNEPFHTSLLTVK
uniref:putative nuclease HARBI1 n=1 Tax=Pristiophorus japonicus TaxID=55135 RepID=UPI00398E31B2